MNIKNNRISINKQVKVFWEIVLLVGLVILFGFIFYKLLIEKPTPYNPTTKFQEAVYLTNNPPSMFDSPTVLAKEPSAITEEIVNNITINKNYKEVFIYLNNSLIGNNDGITMEYLIDKGYTIKQSKVILQLLYTWSN